MGTAWGGANTWPAPIDSDAVFELKNCGGDVRFCAIDLGEFFGGDEAVRLLVGGRGSEDIDNFCIEVEFGEGDSSKAWACLAFDVNDDGGATGPERVKPLFREWSNAGLLRLVE